MDRYDPKGKCSKCGCRDIKDEHREEYIPGDEPWERISRALGNELKSRPEHIRRTCKNCDFAWMDAPLDAETEKDGLDKMTDRICEMARPDTPIIIGTMDVKNGDGFINIDREGVIFVRDGRYTLTLTEKENES